MIVTKNKLVRLPKSTHYIMLKNGLVLYFDRVFFCFLLFLTLVGHQLLHVTLISEAKVRSDKFCLPILFGFVVEVSAFYKYLHSQNA